MNVERINSKINIYMYHRSIVQERLENMPDAPFEIRQLDKMELERIENTLIALDKELKRASGDNGIRMFRKHGHLIVECCQNECESA